MKVDPKRAGATSNASTDAVKLSKTGAAQGTKKAKELGDISTSKDVATVDFSKKGQMASKIRELATPDLNTINEDRVAHFQKLIDEGKYKTDANAIADKLVDEHLIS